MVTGFDIDGQRIASQQVTATYHLATAINNLTIEIVNLTEVTAAIATAKKERHY